MYKTVIVLAMLATTQISSVYASNFANELARTSPEVAGFQTSNHPTTFGQHGSVGGVSGEVVGSIVGGAGALLGEGPLAVVGGAAAAEAGGLMGNEFGHHLQNGDVGAAYNEAAETHMEVTGEPLTKAGPKN